ncbi:MAG: 3-phosphoshikimate 1-carboxyvinyltransferase [Acidimicrobiaceae bacterium]|nr:3-phosphoshikimate 1-carboxyvinyltransferase [Acidimicrobiaceae bacterium]
MTTSPITATTDTVLVAGAGPLRGRVRAPGDKSISHRGLILAALAEGTSVLSGLSRGDDVVRTAAALDAYGTRISAADGDGRVVVIGGVERLGEPERPIDVGNSGTGLRLLLGVAARLPFLSVLIGDESIHRRPMERVVSPLRAMGARIDGRDDGRLAPLVVRGGDLAGIDYAPSVPSAQVKSALLLAGLGARGETVVRERVATRRHTEELLALAGAAPEIGDEGGDHVVRVRAADLSPFELDVPGDPSQAAFLVVAALLVPGSEIVVENVYVGPGRAGFLDVLIRMGADLEIVRRDVTTADLVVRHSALLATEVRGAEVPGCIDEIPVLAVAAAFAEGTTVFADAAELRVKESDRIATISSELARLEVDVEATADGLIVHGGRPRPSGAVRSYGDHRIAMALAVAGLAAGPGSGIAIEGFAAVDTSWPGFLDTLDALR